MEDFEQGDFSAYDWIFGGHQDWQIDSLEVFEGHYAARSGSIGNYQNSEMSLIITVDEDSEISFYHKISSEEGGDGLTFILDGQIADSWQGEEPWTQSSYILTGGEHELVWKYSKNSSGSSGSDCAWIDYIILPLSNIPGTIIGDVTADTQINVQDIVRLVNIILGAGAPPQASELYCGDINGDTVVDIGDLVLLVNIIMGDQLARPATAGELTATLEQNQLIINNLSPIMALDLSYRGTLSVQLPEYQTAASLDGEIQHLLIYTLQAGNAASRLKLGTVSEDFELLACTGAGSDGQVLLAMTDALQPEGQFRVYANYPNPFNPETTLRYELPAAGLTRVEIFDITGRLVTTLVHTPQIAGQHALAWKGTDSQGRPVGAGMYFCHISQGNNQAVLKMLLLK